MTAVGKIIQQPVVYAIRNGKFRKFGKERAVPNIEEYLDIDDTRNISSRDFP